MERRRQGEAVSVGVLRAQVELGQVSGGNMQSSAPQLGGDQHNDSQQGDLVGAELLAGEDGRQIGINRAIKYHPEQQDESVRCQPDERYSQKIRPVHYVLLWTGLAAGLLRATT